MAKEKEEFDNEYKLVIQKESTNNFSFTPPRTEKIKYAYSLTYIFQQYLSDSGITSRNNASFFYGRGGQNIAPVYLFFNLGEQSQDLRLYLFYKNSLGYHLLKSVNTMIEDSYYDGKYMFKINLKHEDLVELSDEVKNWLISLKQYSKSDYLTKPAYNKLKDIGIDLTNKVKDQEQKMELGIYE